MKPSIIRKAFSPLFTAMLLLATACGSEPEQAATPPPATTQPPPVEDPPKDPLEGRKYTVRVPSNYDEAAPTPLVIMLHQMWGSEGGPEWMDSYLGITPEAEARGILVAIPIGTYDPGLDAYIWNATDSCCGFYSQPDDVGFLKAMLDEIKSQYNVDDRRIFLIGQSNGGFMAHRFACEQALEIAAIASLSGAVYKNPMRCLPLAPVGVLHVHGDQDDQVPFEGGSPFGVATIPEVPSAMETVAIWASKNGCESETTLGEPLDLVDELAGTETDQITHNGCALNGAAELWTVHGGQHLPPFNSSWSQLVFDFLMAHPKP